MTRRIIESDTKLCVRELLEIDLNWKESQDTFSIYCEDRKSIETTIQQLKDFGIFPRIIEIHKNRQYIDIYIHKMQTVDGMSGIEPGTTYLILDTIYRLKPMQVFVPIPSTYNLLDMPIERIREMKMTITELYDEYNLDSLLVRIDESDVMINPVVVSIDKEHENSKIYKISNIVISNNNFIDNRSLFLLNGLSGIKIQYPSPDPQEKFLYASWKKIKKKKSHRQISWIALDDAIIIENDSNKFALPNKNYMYIEVFHKIYRIKNNTAIYLFDTI